MEKVLTIPCLNLDEITKFIEYSDNNKIKETETVTNTDNVDTADGGVNKVITNKSVRENIVSSNPQIDNIRYDLIKLLITKVFDESSYIVDEKDNETYFGVGTQIALNTLIEYNMIKN